MIASPFFSAEFVRFLAVGVLNTAFGYGVLLCLLYLGLTLPVALFIATVAGVLFNFKTIGALVFKSGDNSRIGRFVLVYGAIYGLNLASITILKHFGCDEKVAAGIALLPMAVIAYFLNRRFVFND